MNQYRDAREQRIQRLEEELRAEREKCDALERQLAARSFATKVTTAWRSLVRHASTIVSSVMTSERHAKICSIACISLMASMPIAAVTCLRAYLGSRSPGTLTTMKVRVDAFVAFFFAHGYERVTLFVLALIVAWSFVHTVKRSSGRRKLR